MKFSGSKIEIVCLIIIASHLHRSRIIYSLDFTHKGKRLVVDTFGPIEVAWLRGVVVAVEEQVFIIRGYISVLLRAAITADSDALGIGKSGHSDRRFRVTRKASAATTDDEDPRANNDENCKSDEETFHEA